MPQGSGVASHPAGPPRLGTDSPVRPSQQRVTGCAATEGPGGNPTGASRGTQAPLTAVGSGRPTPPGWREAGRPTPSPAGRCPWGGGRQSPQGHPRLGRVLGTSALSAPHVGGPAPAPGVPSKSPGAGMASGSLRGGRWSWESPATLVMRCAPCPFQDLRTVLSLPPPPGELLHPVVYACTAVMLLCLLASAATYIVHQR